MRDPLAARRGATWCGVVDTKRTRGGDLPGLTRAEFDSLVAKEPGDGCWRWLGSRHPSGWGRIRLDRRDWSAQSFAFWLHHGRPPRGGRTYHTCERNADFVCVRPDHLVDDRPRGGKGYTWPPRRLAPQRRSHLKLSGQEVRWLRSAYARGLRLRALAREFELDALARRFGVSVATASRVIRNGTGHPRCATTTKAKTKTRCSPGGIEREDGRR